MNRPERLPTASPAARAPLEASGAAPAPGGAAPRRSLGRLFGDPIGDEQRSLFGEVLDWMFAPLLLLWPLSIGFTFVIARTLADAPFDRALTDHTHVVVAQVVVTGDYLSVPDERRLRELLSSTDDDRVFFQIAAADGGVRVGTTDLPPPALYDFPQAGVVKIRNEVYRGEEIRIAYTYVDAPDDVEATHFPVLVQIGETLDKRSALANEIIKGVIFPQFLILPVSVGLVWFGLSRGLAPLKRMQRTIRERSPDDLSPIDPRGAPEEVSPLVEAFNDLLARLGESIGAQKRFIADAAHQMKTPLAGLRTQSELALRESDAVQLRRRLEQIAISSDRAAHLISQLLALARMENLRDATRLDALDLAPLARSVASDWVVEAMRRGIDFGFESEDAPMPIAGHPILLREMFNNLIDNALRYTPAGGTVTVRLERVGENVCLAVEDSGPGIPPSERALVFERFYRVLGTQTDGSGLGLAIVREIAEQHGANVSVEDATEAGAPGGPGTRFTVTFAALLDGSG